MSRLDFVRANFSDRCAHDPGWPFSETPQGYGRITFEGHTATVHSVACILAHGPRPPGMQACHSCRNKLCFWADHIYWGTPPRNYEDRVRDGTHLRKLTAEQATEIRQRHAAGVVTIADLARQYGSSPTAVSNIVRGLSYR